MQRSSIRILELRPDRKLLDHNFDGYKLNLLSLPHWSLDLPSSVDKVYPDDAQYSFIHAKLFALHNHLVADIWNQHYIFYYIDNDQQVVQIYFDMKNHTFVFKRVYDIPAHEERKPGHFNLCLMFPSSSLAVISDGTGYLHIVSTDIRTKNDQPWKTVHSELILEKDTYFVILDCRSQNNENKLILHCLLQSVNQLAKHFCSILTWVTFELFEHNWKRTSIKQLEGKGIVHYAAIEANFTALYIISDNQFPVIADSEKEIDEAEPKQSGPRNYLYTWIQNYEDITIKLELPRNFDRKQFSVTLTPPNNLRVGYNDKLYLDGRLLHRVDSELTTWTIQDSGHVEILLSKVDSIIWNDLLSMPDCNGEQVMDPLLVESAHARLAHLCSETEPDDEATPHLPLEQMEIMDTFSNEDTTLVRMNIRNHQVTHRCNLSVQQYLFSIPIHPHQVPAIVIRQDVDACVWQPYAKLPNDNEWNLRHEGTLKAFGYIQSSKTNKKFMCSPPNFSYSVVCEASRHIFVYNSLDNGSQLQKRTPGQAKKTVKVGQQYVINIEEYGDVLGVNATNSYLFLLTDKFIVCIDMLLP